VKLSAGDMLYYKPHNATGILLDSFVRDGMTWWKYALRSPRRDNREYHLVNEFESEAYRFLEAIEQGNIAYYACG
jgi:hypothetical protein